MFLCMPSQSSQAHDSADCSIQSVESSASFKRGYHSQFPFPSPSLCSTSAHIFVNHSPGTSYQNHLQVQKGPVTIFKKNNTFFSHSLKCVWVLCLYVCLCIVCVLCAYGRQKRGWVPQNSVTNDCEPLCRNWNQTLVAELVTTDSSFCPPSLPIYFISKVYCRSLVEANRE